MAISIQDAQWLSEENISSLVTATELFPNAPLNCAMVQFTVYSNSITLTFSDKSKGTTLAPAPTAGGVGIVYQPGTYTFKMTRENLKKIRAINNSGVATVYATYFQLRTVGI